MEAFRLIILYWGVMLISYCIASKLRHLANRFGFLDKILTLFIVALVFIMGLKMGANEEVISSLGTIGVQAVLITIVTVGGSMLFVTLGRKVLHLNRQGVPEEDAFDGADTIDTIDTEDTAGTADTAGAGRGNGNLSGERDDVTGTEPADGAEESGGLGMTLLILAFVALGMAGGYLVVPRLFPDLDLFFETTDQMLVVGLCLMLCIIGFSMGLTGEVVKNLKKAGLRVAVIPVLAVVGSLAGGVVYGLLSPLTVQEATAVSAGFGWYTLAPTLITEAGFAIAGAVSFLHNVIREVLGIIIIPLAARKIGYLESTAIPGVAAMDICLPIVERSCRQETIVYSFLTGFLMSAGVPILVPLIVG